MYTTNVTKPDRDEAARLAGTSVYSAGRAESSANRVHSDVSCPVIAAMVYSCVQQYTPGTINCTSRTCTSRNPTRLDY